MSAFITRRGGGSGGGGELEVITGSHTVANALNVNTFSDLVGKKYWVMEVPMSGTGTTVRGINFLIYNDGILTAVHKYGSTVTRKTADLNTESNGTTFFDPTTGMVDIYGIPGARDSEWRWYASKTYNYTIFG